MKTKRTISLIIWMLVTGVFSLSIIEYLNIRTFRLRMEASAAENAGKRMADGEGWTPEQEKEFTEILVRDELKTAWLRVLLRALPFLVFFSFVLFRNLRHGISSRAYTVYRGVMILGVIITVLVEFAMQTPSISVGALGAGLIGLASMPIQTTVMFIFYLSIAGLE